MSNNLIQDSSDLQSRRSFFSRLWMQISNPHPDVVEVGERRRAQLLAGLSLILGFTTALGYIARLINNPGEYFGPASFELLGLTLFSLFAYLFSRSRVYQWGSIIIVTVFSIASIIDVVETKNVGGAIFFLLPAFAIGSALLRQWQISILVILNVVVLFILPVKAGC